MRVTCVVEGPSDAPVVQRLLVHAGLAPGPVYDRGGKSFIDARIAHYNAAARHAPWLVLRDLDHDEPCAGALVHRLLPHPSPGMCFRIAVRQVEAWLLADRDGVAAYLGVSPARVPRAPDDLDSPKRALVELARQSRRRSIRSDLVPIEGTSALVGPGYVGRISEFAALHWNPAEASTSSPSLARCLRALEQFGARRQR